MNGFYERAESVKLALNEATPRKLSVIPVFKKEEILLVVQYKFIYLD